MSTAYPFIPGFLKWTLPSFFWDIPIVANEDFSENTRTKWQKVSILMRRLATSRLIWIYTFAKVHVWFTEMNVIKGNTNTTNVKKMYMFCLFTVFVHFQNITMSCINIT